MPRPAVTLRRATPADESFLRVLFADSRADLATLQLPSTALADLLRLQFDAQRAQYRAGYPAARDEVIELGGHPVGRCWSDQSEYELRLLDLAVLRSHRRGGIGRAVVDGLCERASAAGIAIRLTVWPANVDARRLYADAGFSEGVVANGYLSMERPPMALTSREGA
jgi:ribosomal protein S18 acetylase RimI-like enzyme